MAEEISQGRLRASDIDGPGIIRRLVCATNVTRPSTTAGTAVMGLVSDVLHQMVGDGSWPARWIGGKAG